MYVSNICRKRMSYYLQVDLHRCVLPISLTKLLTGSLVLLHMQYVLQSLVSIFVRRYVATNIIYNVCKGFIFIKQLSLIMRQAL